MDGPYDTDLQNDAWERGSLFGRAVFMFGGIFGVRVIDALGWWPLDIDWESSLDPQSGELVGRPATSGRSR